MPELRRGISGLNHYFAGVYRSASAGITPASLTWTEEQARALITDSGTLKRGLELAGPAKWSNLGQTATAAWGECKGSGSKPYQTSIDLTEPAFKCSCPSRVFPCKHGAGLLLLLVRQPQLFGGTVAPSWLEEWLEKRQQTQEKKPVKAAPKAPALQEAPLDSLAAPDAETATDDTAGAKASQALQKRLTRMTQGAAELEEWLLDLVRAGTAVAKSQPRSYWETPAARLVDNQLPGLASVVRELPAICHSGPDWPDQLLTRLGELYVLVRAFQRLDHQTPEAREEILQQIGVNLKKEDLLARQPTVTDEWQVVGLHTEEEDRLTVRRAWLWGRHTGRYALVLEYAFGSQRFATALVPNAVYAGELVFYPGLLELRAVPVALTVLNPAPPDLDPPGQSPAQLLDAYAAALARHPWLRQWPATLHDVLPTYLPTDDAWVLHHATEPVALPLRLAPEAGWQLLAASGGQPMRVFGEWNGRTLHLLTYFESAQ
ncbi:hypothetical protein MTX78_11760 [Hymenobacter tibetensis]|uniref:SWIM-type domain-containing protein n=1 Tax=Hymenobacter tibetensis TaxID=497967 RepID=A0ABY4CRX7_9BACT|nr:hypothetical protein [Hymenobacter tibetensis]UOG72802.1 hypothetical protein MTX78_11760 [Hymenobacter tibetensis]